jgi:hypothetical protein
LITYSSIPAGSGAEKTFFTQGKKRGKENEKKYYPRNVAYDGAGDCPERVRSGWRLRWW